MAGLYGIEELWDVLDAALSFGIAVDESLRDGWDWADIANFIGPLTSLPAALTGIKEAGQEALDLQEEDIQELQARVAGKIPGLHVNQARKIVYAGLSAGFYLLRLTAVIQDPDLELQKLNLPGI